MKYNTATNIYKIILIAGIGVLLSVLGSSWSLGQSTIKIGIVDGEKVFENWTEKQKADKEFSPLKEKVAGKRQELQDAQDNYEKKKSIIKPETVKLEQEKIIKLRDELQNLYSDVAKQIDLKAKELSTKLSGLLETTYGDIAKKEGYTLILDSRSVRYWDPKIVTDLTDKITIMVNNATK